MSLSFGIMSLSSELTRCSVGTLVEYAGETGIITATALQSRRYGVESGNARTVTVLVCDIELEDGTPISAILSTYVDTIL